MQDPGGSRIQDPGQRMQDARADRERSKVKQETAKMDDGRKIGKQENSCGLKESLFALRLFSCNPASCNLDLLPNNH